MRLYTIKWVTEDTLAYTAKLHLRSVQKPTTRVSRAGMGILQAENVEKKLTFWYLKESYEVSQRDALKLQ